MSISPPSLFILPTTFIFAILSIWFFAPILDHSITIFLVSHCIFSCAVFFFFKCGSDCVCWCWYCCYWCCCCLWYWCWWFNSFFFIANIFRCKIYLNAAMCTNIPKASALDTFSQFNSRSRFLIPFAWILCCCCFVLLLWMRTGNSSILNFVVLYVLFDYCSHYFAGGWFFLSLFLFGFLFFHSICYSFRSNLHWYIAYTLFICDVWRVELSWMPSLRHQRTQIVLGSNDEVNCFEN